MAWSGQDREKALTLYSLNSQISESLYISLQMLEVALRNRIHFVMSESQSPEWIMDGAKLLIERQKEQIMAAQKELQAASKTVLPPDIVAALPFSFWTSMFNSEYESLWQQGLHRIARNLDGKGLVRKDFSRRITPIRILRNRVAHHEPILHWNLPKHHANMIQLCEWLSPDAASWCRSHCRFNQIYPDEGVVLMKDNVKSA